MFNQSAPVSRATMDRPTSSTAANYNSPTRRPSSDVQGINTFNSTSQISGAGLAESMITHKLSEHLPYALEKLEEKITIVQSAMEKLRCLAVLPQTEITSSFGLLEKSDTERSKIRSATQSEARQLAESYLMAFKDLERRFEAQRRRMDVLEGRTARMETLFDEQIQLNKELGAEAVAALRGFVEDERRMVAALNEARAAAESQRAEAEKMKGRIDLLDGSNRELGAQMDALIQEKSALSTRLVNCQAESHSLRLANDQLLHEHEAQAAQLESDQALIEELREHNRMSMSALGEKETVVKRILKERDEMDARLDQCRQAHEKQLEEAKREAEQKLQEELAKLRERLQAERRVELERIQTQSREKTLTESLQSAADAHRKLEHDRDQVFTEKRQLEENLAKYKRKFVAELNRELAQMCQHLGSGGLNTALMEVLVRLNAEHAEKNGQQQNGGLQQNSILQIQTTPQTIRSSSRRMVVAAPNPPASMAPIHQQPLNFSPSPAPMAAPLCSSHISMHDQYYDDHNQPENEPEQQPTCSNKLPPANPFNPPPPPSRSKKESARTTVKKRAEKENAPLSMAKKRPIMATLSINPNNAHTIKSTQVPVNILAATKPWRPPGQSAATSQKPMAKRQREQQEPPQKTPPMNGTKTIHQRIGAPLFTSTPAKKRQFPAFQL